MYTAVSDDGAEWRKRGCRLQALLQPSLLRLLLQQLLLRRLQRVLLLGRLLWRLLRRLQRAWAQMPKKENLPTPKKTEQQAMLIVNLPAQARLLVDDHLTSSTSAQRVLQTPPLTQGSTYAYVLRAEIERDGKTLTETQRVTVRAGGQTRVSFNFARPTVAVAPRN